MTITPSLLAALSSSTPIKIAIIGAGPGGLALARLLQLENIPFTLYDRDGGPNERSQGGSLDLHPDSGLLTLTAAQLYEEFTKRARFDADCMKLVAPTGEVLLNDADSMPPQNEQGPGGARGRPEIDRIELRELLLESLKPGTVRWGSKLRKVEAHTPVAGVSNETYTLHFDHAGAEVTEGPFDVVIGADGARSHVRPLLTDEKPFYSGVSMVELWAVDVDKKNPWLSKYVGPGNVFMYDEGRATFAQRNGNGSIRVYACVKQPETWFETCGIDFSIPEKATQQLVNEYFSDCGEDVKRVILESTDQVILRKLNMLPVGITWKHRGGLTLLGDAAHLMTPFAGEGVNAALHDALNLAEAITRGVKCRQGVDGVTTELAEYEEVLFETSREKAQQTYDSMTQQCFAKDGGILFRDFLLSMGPPPSVVD